MLSRDGKARDQGDDQQHGGDIPQLLRVVHADGDAGRKPRRIRR